MFSSAALHLARKQHLGSFGGGTIDQSAVHKADSWGLSSTRRATCGTHGMRKVQPCLIAAAGRHPAARCAVLHSSLSGLPSMQGGQSRAQP